AYTTTWVGWKQLRAVAAGALYERPCAVIDRAYSSLVSHGVDHEVETHSICHRGVRRRIAWQIHVLPSVAEIGIVGDGHHEASLIVADAEHRGIDIVRLLPCAAPVTAVAAVRNLHDRVDIEKRVENLVTQGKLFERPIRKDFTHLCCKV